MSSFSDMLSFLRKRADLSQKELADKIGVSRSTIGMYETGVREPDFEMLEALADVFNVNMDTLLGKSQSTSGDQSNNNTVGSRFIHFPDEVDEIAERYRNLDDHGKGAVKAILDFEEASVIAEKRQHKPVQPRSDGFVDVKVFDQPAAAGLGNYLSDPIYHMEQYPANEVPDGTEFGVRISGLSMSPTIPNGATAFVQSRGAIEPGKIGIFLLNEEAYCKKLVVDREKQEIRLVSFNPEYEDRIIEDADVFSTMGLVLGWWPHN